MGIKIASRKTVGVGQTTPISGNTKWLSAAAAGGKGAQDLGNQIVSASQRLASAFSDTLNKQEKTNELNSALGHFRTFEQGGAEDNGTYGKNSPYGLINSGSYGVYDPDTNMMSNEVDYKNIHGSVGSMYDQYKKDHIDIVKDDFVRSNMEKQWAASRATAMGHAYQQGLKYQQATNTTVYLNDLNDTLKRLGGGSSEQIDEAYADGLTMIDQWGAFPNLNPEGSLTFKSKFEAAYTKQRAFRAVTFDNLSFDHPEVVVTDDGSPITTTVENYDRAISLLNHDWTALNDPNMTEEKKQQIIDAVMSLDNGDVTKIDGQRASLLQKFERDRSLRNGVIESQNNIMVTGVISQLNELRNTGTLTQEKLQEIWPNPSQKDQSLYNVFLNQTIGKTKTDFTGPELLAFRSLKLDIQQGESEDPIMQGIIDLFMSDPEKAKVEFMRYVGSKFPLIPDKHWTPLNTFLKETSKNWKVSKLKANALKLAENSLILQVLNPDQHKKLVLENATAEEFWASVIANGDETSITEARNQVQNLMMNFEEVLQQTLIEKKKLDGTSFESMLSAPLYRMDENGQKVGISGYENANYIVHKLIKEQQGATSSATLSNIKNKINQKKIDEANEIKQAQKRTVYSSNELTNKLTDWSLNNGWDKSLTANQLEIAFDDGSTFSMPLPEGMTQEDGAMLYYSKIAQMQKGDPNLVVNIPSDSPIPQGWPSRLEPLEHQKARQAALANGTFDQYLQADNLTDQMDKDVLTIDRQIQTLSEEKAQLDEFIASGDSKNIEAWQNKSTDLEIKIGELELKRYDAQIGIVRSEIESEKQELTEVEQQIEAKEATIQNIEESNAAEEKARIEAENRSLVLKAIDTTSENMMEFALGLSNFLIGDFYSMGGDARNIKKWIVEKGTIVEYLDSTTNIDYSSYDAWHETGISEWKAHPKPTKALYKKYKSVHDKAVKRDAKLLEMLENVYKRRGFSTDTTAGDKDEKSFLGMEHFENETEAREYLRSRGNTSAGGVWYIETKDGRIIK